jgi:hypothetical protein
VGVLVPLPVPDAVGPRDSQRGKRGPRGALSGTTMRGGVGLDPVTVRKLKVRTVRVGERCQGLF